MRKTDDAALAWLHDLLRITRDSADGYATAAADSPDPKLGRLFAHFGQERHKVAADLERRLRALRGDTSAPPTLAGAAHRAWMDLRAGADADPVASLLIEIERAEDLAVDAFRTAVKEPDLDAATRALVQRHYELVQAAHDRIKQLRDRGGRDA